MTRTALILAGCAVAALGTEAGSYSPCADSLYVVLKHKGLKELSANEMTYYMKYHDLCREVREEQKAEEEREEDWQETKPRVRAGILISVFCTIGITVAVMVLTVGLAGTR